MPTDPFVSSTLDEQPRHEQNLQPGVSLPAARPWRAARAGDLAPGQPEGTLLGSPGPNIGYAVGLVDRAATSMTLADHEHRDDAEAVAAELAMRRAACFGRAPVAVDVQVAFALLGYDDRADGEFATWRGRVVGGASHDYTRRRAVVDAVPEEMLALTPDGARSEAAETQRMMREALDFAST